MPCYYPIFQPGQNESSLNTWTKLHILELNLVFSNAVFGSSEGHGRLNRHTNFFVSFNVKLRLFVYNL